MEVETVRELAPEELDAVSGGFVTPGQSGNPVNSSYFHDDPIEQALYDFKGWEKKRQGAIGR